MHFYPVREEEKYGALLVLLRELLAPGTQHQAIVFTATRSACLGVISGNDT